MHARRTGGGRARAWRHPEADSGTIHPVLWWRACVLHAVRRGLDNGQLRRRRARPLCMHRLQRLRR
eukprot:1913438-Rhodomonas_salina.1